MPLALDGKTYLCHGCENGGSLADTEPLRPEHLGVVTEKDVVNTKVGRRVLGIVFADPTPGGSAKGTMPVLVMGGVEVSPDRLAVTFRPAVMQAFADCTGSNEDGTCGGVNTCKLVALLTEHRTDAPEPDRV